MAKKTKKESHVSEKKKQIVKDLAELMKKKTVMIVSIKSIPSSKLQGIRKKLRGKADIKISKKSLIDFALEHSKDEKVKELVKYVQEDCAMLFSNDDAFELSAFLSKSKSPTRAKTGQIAIEDIHIEAGPTELMPGPDISALSAVGLKVKIEGGKIAIQEPKLLVRAGEAISEEKASVLSKLNITPFKIGLEPVAAFFDGKIYTDLKIDLDEILNEIKNSFTKALAFSVSISYPSKENISYILAKAASHEKAINNLIKQDNQN